MNIQFAIQEEDELNPFRMEKNHKLVKNKIQFLFQ